MIFDLSLQPRQILPLLLLTRKQDISFSQIHKTKIVSPRQTGYQTFSDGSVYSVSSFLSELPVQHCSPNMEEVELTVLNKSELLIVDTLEHEFHSSGDDSMLLLLRLAQFVTCGLILGTNVPMIIFIMKQKYKTFLDWMIVFDCFLCLSNLYPITLGLHYDRKGNRFTINHYNDNHSFCFWVFFTFFFNLCNRLLTPGIVIYRFAFALGSSFFFSPYRKKVLKKIIILTIFFIPLTLTGWNVYYREHYKHFLGEVKN